MYLPKIKLQTKLLILFILISALPLVISNILWFNSSRVQILNSTADRLDLTAIHIAREVENYLSLKQTVLTIHSETAAIKELDIPKSTIELENFLSQDQDIYELSLLNSSGKELIRITRDKVYPVNELVDQSSSPAFKKEAFLKNKQYVSPLYIDETGQPSIYISIPLVKKTTSTGIFGALKANYHLTSLWKFIYSFKIGNTGYVFVVDDKGNAIAHPDQHIALQQKNLRGIAEVDKFLMDKTNPSPGMDDTAAGNAAVRNSINEFGIPALTIHNVVKLTDWGVIAQIPISDTLSETNQVALFAVILSLLFLASVILLSLWISRQIVKPIEELRLGSSYIGAGNLNYRLNIKSGDEIEMLGKSFNEMSQNLQTAFSHLEKDKELISVERNKNIVTLSNIADAVMAVDLSYKIIIFNKAAQALTGLTAQEVLGKPIDNALKVFDKEDIVPINKYCPIRTDHFEGIVFQGKGLKIVSSKKASYVNLTVSQIREASTANLGGLMTLHDITKEKQLEEMKLDFVSMAAHELRTPLTSIKGYLDVFIHENAAKLNSEQKTFLDRIHISAQQLTALVENLLSVSRIERGVMSINIQPIDWVVNLKEVVDEFIERAKEKNIQLVFVVPTQPIPHIKVDKLRVNEVLENLLSNAIAYTQPTGIIKIWVEASNEEVTTHIQDSGQGIPEEALPHLFTKFFRVSGSLEQGSKGTGLGLYISKSIIDLHKGKIWATSKLGQGSIFSFSLPVNLNSGIDKVEKVLLS